MIAVNPLNPENSGTLPASQAVPVTRKVNGKELTDDISLTAADVDALPSDWTPTASSVGAPTYINLSNLTLAEISTKAKNNQGLLGYIDWSSAIAPDANNTIVLCGSWMVIAISCSGKIYSLDINANTWIQKS